MTSLQDTYAREAAFSGNRFREQVNFGFTRFSQTASEIDHDCLFQNCEFLAPTNFRDAMFEGFYPDFHGVMLHERTLFSAGEQFWPKNVEQPLEQARSTCSSIRHILAKQGLPEDEHFFFRREMHFAGRIGSIWQRLPYLLFGLFSEYGYSIARPFWWLFGIWMLGAIVIAEHFVAETAQPLLGSDDWTAMALSFSNLFPVFGFGRAYFGAEFLQALPQHLKVLSGLQTVASLPLLFFLGLGLRQRFRLR
ncbi:hypothetical protein PNH50_05025 [Leisingera aquaemixtae]|uniref:hypothetical protein n=1 Tax=Leisingera aquaemixtae TaxID=1396826 RepID=UPI0039842509